MELRSSSKRHIDKLPEELLTKIFLILLSRCPHDSPPLLTFPYCGHSFLPPIGYVSRRWRRLLLSPTVCSRVILHIPINRPITAKSFAAVSQMASGIEQLCLFGISTNSITPFATVLPKLPAFPKVKNLRFNEGPRLNQAESAVLVKLFPLVESFAVEGKNKWLDDGILHVMAAEWSKLGTISLFDCPKVTGSGLIEFCSVANRLSSIDLDGIPHLTDRHIDVITRLLRKTLKSIQMGTLKDKLTGSAVQFVAQNCSNLEKLGIRRPLNISHVTDLVMLRSFTIDFGGQSCEGLDDCFCRPFGQLRELKIFGAPRLTDSHLKHIANSCPLLETLGLSMCGKLNPFVTDAGVKQIVDKCKNLTDLTLEEKEVTWCEEVIFGAKTILLLDCHYPVLIVVFNLRSSILLA